MYFIVNVFPVPVFPYINKFEGKSFFRTGARMLAVCSICSSLCSISSGIYPDCKTSFLINKDSFRRELFPNMIDRATELADEKRVALIKAAQREMALQLNAEIERLKVLKKLNDHVSEEEIQALMTQRDNLKAAIKTARLRCEAIRLVWKK